MFSRMLFSFKLCLNAKIQEHLRRILPEIQKYAHFSLVSLSPRTRSRPGAERIRQVEGRLSRPPRTCFIRASPEDVKQNKQMLQPCRRQKQNKRSTVCRRKIPRVSNYHLEIMIIFEIIHALQTLRYSQNYRNSYSTRGIIATTRLSRLAPVRVHVDVRNGHGRANGVGAAPRRRRSNLAI